MKFEDFQEYTLRLFDKILVVPNLIISTANYLEAYRLCRDVDESDTPYVALALELNIDFITRDERLATGLRQKGFNQICTFSEIMEKGE